MSNLIFPTGIKGLTFAGERMPVWKTGYQESLSGKVSTIRYQQYPIYEWVLNFELLRHDVTPSELLMISGLFNQLAGRWDTFLYQDPLFNAVTLEPFGTGNGTTLAFPLIARHQNIGGPGVDELIQNFSTTPVIRVNGVVQTTPAQYTLGPTGIVTFAAAPGVGLPLTWTGGFYYRCRIQTDMLSFNEFMTNWWQLRSIRFRSVKL